MGSGHSYGSGPYMYYYTLRADIILQGHIGIYYHSRMYGYNSKPMEVLDRSAQA